MEERDVRVRVEGLCGKWRVAFWDNRCVKHLALHDVHDHQRIMRRIQIAGDRPQ